MKACTAGEPLACCEYCAHNPANIKREVTLWFEPEVTHYCIEFKLKIDEDSL
jgi:hypothetical protein